MRRQPPHILVTTPESLFILLTSKSGRDMLATVRTVIVDELHALAGNKRGSHLSLSLERLEGLCGSAPTRVGISATQKPMSSMRDFLIGAREAACRIVDTGFVRERDIAIEVPGSPLQAVMAGEVWQELYDRITALVLEHRSTLIFVNTRRLAERVARHLAERLDESVVTAHHGSLSREHRLDAEQRLKAGKLRALVATASLELGIDIGDVDLTIQLASPRGIATLLQRVGRSGHGVDALPKGRLFPLSRDDLVECTALLDAVRREELDAIRIPEAPLDVLSQQIVAEVAARECDTGELFDTVRRAWPYKDLPRETFDDIVHTLADGYSTRRGRRGAHLHFDAVNGRLRARPAARLISMTNGGAIPDQFDYDVILSPEDLPVGTVNEDFAFESLPGDIFQLGNTSYRILKVETGKVYVEDARGQPPNIPFWFGEAPGRSDELSIAVSRLRSEIADRLSAGPEAVCDWLEDNLGLPVAAASQLVDYLSLSKAALSVLPTREEVVFERFFDESGDTHLVIHSPYGSRLNRAWGLALRKRFCRKFNFELQAAALEDSIVLSLGPTHSFPLDEATRYLRSSTVRDVLTQALLTAPMFGTHWRWSATIGLAVQRFRNGKKVPPQFQRNDAEDLLAVIFPDQLACAENLTGAREVPDHPLVHQTVADCLHDLMDIEGLERLLGRIESGDVAIVTRDLSSPSPLSQEIISARPYAFLDDAPAEERRTLAIRARHLVDIEDAAGLADLDPAAIRDVCEAAWPSPRNADELHDALSIAGFATSAECEGNDWGAFLAELSRSRRATELVTEATRLVVCAEWLAAMQQVHPDHRLEPPIEPVARGTPPADRSGALRELVRGRLEVCGPVTADALAEALAVELTEVEIALAALESEGYVMRGRYTGIHREEWCERRLLARIHKGTIRKLRREIEPVSPAIYMRFLFDWHGAGDERRAGPESVRLALARLEGFPAAASAWDKALLPTRVDQFMSSELDQAIASGEFLWLRAPSDDGSHRGRSAPVSNTRILLLSRSALDHWLPLIRPGIDAETPTLSSNAARVHDILDDRGATFFADLVRASGLLRTHVEEALAELVARGLVTADSFAGIRALTTPSARRASFSRPLRKRGISVDGAGRWELVSTSVPGWTAAAQVDEEALAMHAALVLLDRYGVVFRAIVQREMKAMPPWRLVLRGLRRLEDRGEVRGGRFVSGFTGEQFALPDAVVGLRAVRRLGDDERLIAISAADPLNLAGIVTPGDRVPATGQNRLLYRNGQPVAVQSGGRFTWLGEPDARTEWSARNMLLRYEPRLTYVSTPGQT